MINKKYLIIIPIIIILLLLILFFNKSDKKEFKLVIESKDLIIKRGESVLLKAYVENDDNAIITWSSSDNSISNVENGLVKGINYGNSVITATYIDTLGQIYQDNCNVKVIDGDINVELVSFNLPDGDLVMNINDEYNLMKDITLEPNDGYINKLIFTSANEMVIDVDNDGKVLCKEKGNSIIKVSINDKIDKSIRVYCDSNIEKSEIIINPTSIELNNDIIKIGETKQIKYILTPSLSVSKYLSFTSDNPSIVSVDNNGYIKGLKEGKTIIHVTNINGISSSCIVEVEKNIIKATSINVPEDSIELYVNDSYTINPTILPVDATNQELTFEADDYSIISISPSLDKKSATIMAHKGGNAIISIKNKDGIEKKINVIVHAFKNVNPTILSTGSINSSLLGPGTQQGFNDCRNNSPNLTLKINGRWIGQDGSVSIKVGESFNVEVYLPTKCGTITTLTRTSPDGASNWRELINQDNNPFVVRTDSKTFVSGINKYTWTIAGIKAGNTIVSQTAEFDVKAPNGAKSNIKSMIRLNVKITNK